MTSSIPKLSKLSIRRASRSCCWLAMVSDQHYKHQHQHRMTITQQPTTAHPPSDITHTVNKRHEPDYSTQPPQDDTTSQQAQCLSRRWYGSLMRANTHSASRLLGYIHGASANRTLRTQLPTTNCWKYHSTLHCCHQQPPQFSPFSHSPTPHPPLPAAVNPLCLPHHTLAVADNLLSLTCLPAAAMARRSLSALLFAALLLCCPVALLAQLYGDAAATAALVGSRAPVYSLNFSTSPSTVVGTPVAYNWQATDPSDTPSVSQYHQGVVILNGGATQYVDLNNATNANSAGAVLPIIGGTQTSWSFETVFKVPQAVNGSNGWPKVSQAITHNPLTTIQHSYRIATIYYCLP